MSDIRQLILATISDVVSDLVYYDRKDDEDLPRGAIEQAVADGTITVDEIVDQFRRELTEAIGR